MKNQLNKSSLINDILFEQFQTVEYVSKSMVRI
jgi:hypothetical protein